jgi:hypothetical protein
MEEHIQNNNDCLPVSPIFHLPREYGLCKAWRNGVAWFCCQGIVSSGVARAPIC